MKKVYHKKQKKIQRLYGTTSSQNLKPGKELETCMLTLKIHCIKSIKTEDNKEKANILSEYFSSVFTKEPEGDVPVLNYTRVQQDIQAITVTENMVLKVLQTLKTDKSPGPDGLHPRLLKELSESIVNPLCMYNI